MKKLFFILCLCLGCSALAKAEVNTLTDGWATFATDTGRRDTLPTIPPMLPYVLYSAKPASPASSNNVSLTFNQTLSNVQISVCTTTGAVVYQNVVNVVSGSQCVIDVTGWAKGSYVLRIHVDGGTDDVFYFEI